MINTIRYDDVAILAQLATHAVFPTLVIVAVIHMNKELLSVKRIRVVYKQLIRKPL